MAKVKLAPLWLITAAPIGPNRWNLIVRNAGHMSSVFVPLGVTLTGSRGNEIRDFKFVARGSSAVDPGDTVSYEVSAIIYDWRTGDLVSDDGLKLSISYSAINDLAFNDQILQLPVFQG